MTINIFKIHEADEDMRFTDEAIAYTIAHGAKIEEA